MLHVVDSTIWLSTYFSTGVATTSTERDKDSNSSNAGPLAGGLTAVLVLVIAATIGMGIVFYRQATFRLNYQAYNSDTIGED